MDFIIVYLLACFILESVDDQISTSFAILLFQ